MPGLRFNVEADGVLNSCWMSTVVVDESYGVTKEKLMAGLDRAGIDSRPFFYPLSSLEAYADEAEAVKAKARNVVSYSVSPRAINLPSGLALARVDVERVCRELRNQLGA